MSSATHAPLRSFAALRGARHGALFIIASGPSVKDFPLQRYARYPMLAMNGSIGCFAEAGIAPYFYLCDDSSFVRNRLPLLLQATELAENLALSPRVIDTLLEREPHALDGRAVYDFERVNRPPEGASQWAIEHLPAWRGVIRVSSAIFPGSARGRTALAAVATWKRAISVAGPSRMPESRWSITWASAKFSWSAWTWTPAGVASSREGMLCGVASMVTTTITSCRASS